MFLSYFKMEAIKFFNIVIAGVESTRTDVGSLPYFENILEAKDILSDRDYTLRILIVGTGSNYACRLASPGMLGPTQIENYVHDSTIIQSYVEHQEEDEYTVRVYPQRVYSIKGDKYVDQYQEGSNVIVKLVNTGDEENIVEDFRNFTDPTVYIHFNGVKEPILSTYEIMSFFDDFTVDNRYVLSLTKGEELSISNIATDFLKIDVGVTKTDILTPKIYDVFSGAEFDKTHSSGADYKEGINIINTMCKVVDVYYKYGVHNLEFTNAKEEDLPNWMLNPETLAIKGILRTYGINPTAKDIPEIIEITTSSVYRKQLMTTMSKIIANFMISNKFATIEQVASFGGWTVPTLYGEFSKILSAL
jgi:hypothetical protein